MALNYEKKARPFGVTLLAAYILWLAAWNGLRLDQAIFFWKTLANYGAHPVYIFASGGIWLIGSLALVWGLWRGKGWAWWAALGGAAGYAVWYWFDRLVLQKLPSANWPFALTVTIVLLFIILMILFSRSVMQFFLKRPVRNPKELPIKTDE